MSDEQTTTSADLDRALRDAGMFFLGLVGGALLGSLLAAWICVGIYAS